jgi:hypothetical protein
MEFGGGIEPYRAAADMKRGQQPSSPNQSFLFLVSSLGRFDSAEIVHL